MKKTRLCPRSCARRKGIVDCVQPYSVKYFELEPQLEIGYMQMEWVYINQDDFKLLLKHPYLSYQQVKSVVNYRNELGDLNSLSELLQLEGFGVKDTARLNPYINFKTN